MSRFKNRFNNRAGDRISDRLDNQGESSVSNVMSAALKTGLLAYWSFSAGSSVPDIIPGGITMGSDIAMTYGAALIGQGATFNGSTSKIITSAPLSTTAGMDSSHDVTMSCWIKFASASQLITPYFNGPINTAKGYGLVMGNDAANGAGAKLGILMPGKTYSPSSFSVSSTTLWHHIVITRTAGNWQLYVNNATQYTPFSTNPNAAPDTASTMGRDVNGVVASLSGSMDEVGFWTRALSSDEVSALYNGGLGLTY